MSNEIDPKQAARILCANIVALSDKSVEIVNGDGDPNMMGNVLAAMDKTGDALCAIGAFGSQISTTDEV